MWRIENKMAKKFIDGCATFRMVVLIVAAMFSVFSAFCADEVTTELYPDADVVTLDSKTCTSYNPDGTYYMEDENWVKILTEKGRREESTLSMRYSKRYGSAGVPTFLSNSTAATKLSV